MPFHQSEEILIPQPCVCGSAVKLEDQARSQQRHTMIAGGIADQFEILDHLGDSEGCGEIVGNDRFAHDADSYVLLK